MPIPSHRPTNQGLAERQTKRALTSGTLLFSRKNRSFLQILGVGLKLSHFLKHRISRHATGHTVQGRNSLAKSERSLSVIITNTTEMIMARP